MGAWMGAMPSNPMTDGFKEVQEPFSPPPKSCKGLRTVLLCECLFVAPRQPIRKVDVEEMQELFEWRAGTGQQRRLSLQQRALSEIGAMVCKRPVALVLECPMWT